VINGSFMRGWKVSEVGMKLDSCTLIDLDLGPVIFREDASAELTKGWLTIQNCRFIRCRVPESLALLTRNCVFEKCTFAPAEEKLQTKAPLQATLYIQDCTNQPQTGPGRTIETKPAAQLSTTPGASLPYELKNSRLDFQNPPQ
jgi:hypothetical protein